MKTKLLLLTLFLILLQTFVSAQTVSRVGTTAAPFLKIGVGGRVIGMGEAGVTVADDISAMYWNPAGLSGVRSLQLFFNHFDWIADISFNYAGLAVHVPGAGSFGIQMTYWNAGEIERTTLFEQNGTGEKVSMGSVCFGGSFARELTDRFSFGFNAKYIRETLWHCHSSGFALDAGVLFTTQFYNLKLGASISNYGTKLKLEGQDLLVQHDIDLTKDGNNANVNAHLSTDSYNLPVFFRFGVSMNFFRDVLNLSSQDLIVAVNAIHPNDNKEYLNVGSEYMWHDLFALRLGYHQLFLKDAEGGLTTGFGLRPKLGNFQINLDYAALDYGRLDYVHKFSFTFLF